MVFTEPLEFYDSEGEMPPPIIAIQGSRSEHELHQELIEIFYKKTVFELYIENDWKLGGLSKEAMGLVRKIGVVLQEPR